MQLIVHLNTVHNALSAMNKLRSEKYTTVLIEKISLKKVYILNAFILRCLELRIVVSITDKDIFEKLLIYDQLHGGIDFPLKKLKVV